MIALSSMLPKIRERFISEKNEFQWARNEPGRLRLTGRRLSDTYREKPSLNGDLNPFVISKQDDNNWAVNKNASHISYDSESFSTRPCKEIYWKSGKVKNQFQLVNLTLEFFNDEDASEFYKKIIQCFSKCSTNLSQPELATVSKPRVTFFMDDQEFLAINDFEEISSWLNKYLQYEKQTLNVFELNTWLGSANAASDSSSINASTLDLVMPKPSYLKFSSLKEKTNSCPTLDGSKLLNPNDYMKVKRKVSRQIMKLHRSKSSAQSSSSSSSPKKPETMSCHTMKLLDKKVDSLNALQTNLSLYHPQNLTNTHGMALSHHISDPLLAASLQSEEYAEPDTYRIKMRKHSVYKCHKSEKISICIGTWNVNGRNGGNLNLDDWLMPPAGQPPADVYVIGLQELDLSFKVITLNKISSSRSEDLWIHKLEEALGGLLKPPTSNPTDTDKTSTVKTFAAQWHQHTGGGYLRVRRVRLAGMMMMAYISAKLSVHLRHHEVSHQVVPTGVLNVMGNKGGVGLRMTIFNSSLCFVNCHLAAGKEKVKRRNDDFKEIVSKMSLLLSVNPKNLPFPIRKSYVSVHDVIFIFGDLNYRIAGLDSDRVRKLIQQKNYPALLRNDEVSS
ncbi:unnamed protein product [Heterobilharzia americana]|nr:unnamed protein product [Heterobilharzia americana]